MRMPMIYTPKAITEWNVMKESKELEGIKWLHARPIGYDWSIFFCLRKRLGVAWKVFTGKHDALDWEE